MTWDGNQFGKPLVFLDRETVESLASHRGYRVPEEVESWLSSGMGGELLLLLMVRHRKVEQAVELMACMIAPRVGVWWAVRCFRMVVEDVKRDFAKDGLTPSERRERKVQSMVEKLSDSGDIEAMIEEHHRTMGAYREKLESELQQKKAKSPLEVVSEKMKAFSDAMAAFVAESGLDAAPLSPEERHCREMLTEGLKQEMQEAMERQLAVFRTGGAPELPPELETARTDRIFDAIRQKTEAVKPAIDAEMAKYFPLKLKGLPPKASQAKKDAAVAAALRWLLVPSDDNGKLACEAAIAAQSGPESMLAFAAFWSSTNLKTETGLAPTNPALPPMGISKTLLQLALMEGGEMDYDARYEEFLRIGIECADGTSTWDEYGNEVRVEEGAPPAARGDDVFGRRSGFGRD